MARQSIDKAGTRARLDPRREPYWGAPIDRGLFLGFRKLEQGGTWIARVNDGGTHRYHALGGADILQHPDAVQAARAWAKSLRAGVDTTDVQTVADACREYVKDRRREQGEANADDCEGRFQRLIYKRPIGKVKLSRLRTSHIKDWRAKLDMAATSSNRNLAVLKAALNFAVTSRYVEAGNGIEWHSVKMLPIRSRRDLYLTRDQRRTLIAALPTYARPFVTALCLLMVRPGALAACTVGDFDGDRAALKITHDKAGAGRTIALSHAAVDLLRTAAGNRDAAEPLLPMGDGAHWHKDRWVQLIRRTAAGAELPRGTCLYSLRHSGITDALTAGVDSLTVARMAGTSLAMIEKYYGHLQHKHAADALQVLAL